MQLKRVIKGLYSYATPTLLVAFYSIFDITLTANHLPGACNTTADQLSRNCMTSFFTMNPDVSRVPAPLPTTISQLISPDGPDWT